MSRIRVFVPFLALLALLSVIALGSRVSAQVVPACISNTPGENFLVLVDAGENLVLGACATTQPKVDGANMAAATADRWNYTKVVSEGSHTYTAGTVSFTFTVTRLDQSGEAIDFEGIHIEVDGGAAVNTVVFISPEGKRVASVSGQGFGSWGNSEWWDWSSSVWSSSAVWFEDHNILANNPPAPQGCNTPVPFKPFAWALETHQIGVCAPVEDAPPTVNGLVTIPEFDAATPYNWITEVPVTGTLTIQTSGMIAAGSVGKTVIAEQERLQPGQSSAFGINLTAGDFPVNVVHYTTQPASQVDRIYSVRGFAYDLSPTTNYATWYYRASGWSTSPEWLEFMVIGLEQTQWQIMLPVLLNQQDCKQSLPHPIGTLQGNNLGVCAASQPKLDGSDMTATPGLPDYNYVRNNVANGAHVLVIGSQTYNIQTANLGSQGSHTDEYVMITAKGQPVTVVKHTNHSNFSAVYTIRGYGFDFLQTDWGDEVRYWNGSAWTATPTWNEVSIVGIVNK